MLARFCETIPTVQFIFFIRYLENKFQIFNRNYNFVFKIMILPFFHKLEFLGFYTCKLDFCEQCVVGKIKRVKFGTAIHNTEGILDYIHTDVWGPTKTASLGGKQYFVTFVDEFSRRVWVYTLKSKDEVFETFLVWKKMVENQTWRKIKVLRSDNGT